MVVISSTGTGDAKSASGSNCGTGKGESWTGVDGVSSSRKNDAARLSRVSSLDEDDSDGDIGGSKD